ncbi:MAG: hypothetical protein ACM3JQ_06120 [Candidatus Eiseniibacteriota bacterium]|jgi:hypothetical protein
MAETQDTKEGLHVIHLCVLAIYEINSRLNQTQSSYMEVNHDEKCPAVAQPGRAFGCSSRLKIADREKQPIRQTIAVTEESQAQMASGSASLEQILPAGYNFA